MKIFKAKRKVQLEGRDKPIWADVGLTVMVGDYEGQQRVSVVDERTGLKYPAFPLEQRQQSTGDDDLF